MTDVAGSYRIERLAENDAAALIDCFQRCYGSTYPSDDFYDLGQLKNQIRSRSLRSVVVRTATGDIVGHTGLTIRHANANACEAGNTLVDPAHRGKGLLDLLGRALADLVRAEGFCAYLSYPTTAHAIMQQAMARRGGVETGVMLDYIPAETEYREVNRASGRLAVTVVYQPFAVARKRAVWIAEDFAATVKGLYQAAQLDRVVSVSRYWPRAERTVATTTRNARRGLLHINVEQAGIDLPWSVHAEMTQQPSAITHVDLMLDDPGVGAAAQELRKRGFLFCALLPELMHTDVLRLQYLAEPSDRSFSPALVNADAKRLLQLILKT